jgi:hypothetical protein
LQIATMIEEATNDVEAGDGLDLGWLARWPAFPGAGRNE